ncbi:hypothetical protein K3148_05495 [Qipengyuania aurantiaca]|uniref:DUF4908 domain-containing protein n=1 Tax=Qipengyuania aurantiaca TaxID=2867233 RepID=A0ABX8ZST6_9SPHN|nr:hypothetical protein [Qipengyuania aurantiaca]QZD90839.1 hypothetical protein K3148_05495 [Qipengyuania aurantiaca]
MTYTTRRAALQALAWCSASLGFGLPTVTAARAAVAFPKGPVRLRRELVRGLGDGAAIVVTRDWECRFILTARGARVEGRQVAVDVEAPAPLAALAEIERKREVTGLFPLEIDTRGLIVDWPEVSGDIAQAVRQAAIAMDRKAAEQDAGADAKRYLAEIGKTAATLVSQVPRDLFFPQTGELYEQRDLPLAGGVKGSYEVTMLASTKPGRALLDHSERRIVTRVGDSSRVSRESWTIL